MDVTPSDRRTWLRWLQFEKTFSPHVVTEAGIVMNVMLLYENALLPMVVS